MKTLKFTESLVPLILSGAKTATWRLFDDKHLQVGDELFLVNQKTGEEFAQAKITRVQEKELGTVAEADFDGHERYENRDKMLETYRSYYGDQVNEKTLVKVIDFELL